MTKQEFLNTRIIRLGNHKQEFFPAVKIYSDCQKAVEVDLTEFVKIFQDAKEYPYNPAFLQKGQLPFKQLMFTHTEFLEADPTIENGEEDQITDKISVLLTKMISKEKSIYELHFFERDRSVDAVNKELSYDGFFNIEYVLGQDAAFTYHKKFLTITNEYSTKSRTLEQLQEIKKAIDLENEILKCEREIYDAEMTLYAGNLTMYVSAITYMNEIGVFNLDTSEEILIDNVSIEKIGNETKKIYLKDSIAMGKFKLLNPRQSPREHQVRGHFRHYANGRVIWITDHTRGDASKGVITPIYVVKDSMFSNLNKRFKTFIKILKQKIKFA